MSVRDTAWLRLRRRLGPLTRKVPYGHVVTEAAVYARPYVPGLSRPARRFVLFAQGRSGSTLLADLLNCHPQIYCADEILTWERRDPARYARGASVGHHGDTYGFKVKIYQLTDAQGIADPNAFLRRLHDDGWLVLHLARRNVLRQALSSEIANARSVYHEAPGAGGRQPVRVDPAAVLLQADHRTGFLTAEDAALAGIPHAAFSYEDALLRPEAHQAAASRAFAHLGLPDVAVRTGLSKIGDAPLENLVANAEELRSAVAASPYAALLAED